MPWMIWHGITLKCIFSKIFYSKSLKKFIKLAYILNFIFHKSFCKKVLYLYFPIVPPKKSHRWTLAPQGVHHSIRTKIGFYHDHQKKLIWERDNRSILWEPSFCIYYGFAYLESAVNHVFLSICCIKRFIASYIIMIIATHHF